MFIEIAKKKTREMRRTRYAVPNGSSRGLSTHQWFLIIGAFFFFSLLCVSVAVSLSFSPPTARVGLVTVAPASSYTTVTIPTSPPSTTVPTTVENATTTAPPPTTAPPYPLIAITCPANVTVVLGASLEPTYTGGSPAASGGCTNPQPIVQYVDTVVGTSVAKRRMRMRGAVEMMIPPRIERSVSEREGVTIEPSSVGRGKEKRSPSFATPNYVVSGSTVTIPYTSVATPSVVAGAGPSHVVVAYNGANGAMLEIKDKNLTSVAGPFLMHTLGGAGNCSGPTTSGDAQVLYDADAGKWVLMEHGVPGVNAICVYVSANSDPTSAYTSFTYESVTNPMRYAKVGVWNRVYIITLDMSSSTSLCVLDRLALISYPTLGLPLFFCAAPFNGPLPNFAGSYQAWTPIHAESTLPPTATEAAGAPSIGAVFFRPIDDEFHYAANTPTTDQIEIEHWYNINFTASTFNALRYKIAVQDFNTNPGSCNSSSACIPNPDGGKLDPVRGVLMHRVAYRFIPSTGQQSVVCALTSHANGVATARVAWFELRWTSPAFYKFQQGMIGGGAGIEHRWMPAINMDQNGTILVSYSLSDNATTFPSLVSSSRLANDPVNGLRNESVIAAGTGPGGYDGSTEWGSYASVSVDPNNTRTFYVGGQAASSADPWAGKVVKLRILGETIHRNWTANDYCGNGLWCVQEIICV